MFAIVQEPTSKGCIETGALVTDPVKGPDWPAVSLIRILLVTSAKAAWGIFCKMLQGQGNTVSQTVPGTQNWKVLLIVCPCFFLQTDFFAPLTTWQNMATLNLPSLHKTGSAT